MPLLNGDIAIARSAQMSDTAAGGGPPTAQLLPDGASNAIVPDLSEDARVGGLVEIRHLHGVLRNTDTDPLTGANIILAEPPDDPSVSITLVPTRNTFARRPDIERLIEATSVPGAEFSGFLLENHVTGQRSLQLGQRPGAEPPGVNTTLVLIADEGKSGERVQYVRVRRVTTAQATFTEALGQGNYADYPIQIATCELFSPLSHDFAGSPPNRLYARQTDKTRVRRVTASDAGTFYSASRLVQPAAAGDLTLKVASIYTQLVPGTRTETPLTDQRPGAARTVELQDAVGKLQVQAASHTARIMVGEATRGYTYTWRLKPTPAPGSIAVSYLVMGTWYTLLDDGAGQLTGSGSGAVSYHSGALSVTLTALPDLGSPVIVSWADTAPYVNACAAGPLVAGSAPAFSLALEAGGQAEGSVIKWTSGGQQRQAVCDAAGNLSGDATGKLMPAVGQLFIRPALWPDAGAAFELTMRQRATASKSFASVAVDAGGFAQLVLDEEPAPGSVVVEWYTAQRVSSSSGSNLGGTSIVRGSVGRQLAPGGRYFYTHDKTTTATRGSKTERSSSGTRVARHTASDDGAGHFADGLGQIDYAGKTLTLRMVTKGGSTEGYQSDYDEADAFSIAGWPAPPTAGDTRKGGAWGNTALAEEVLAASTVLVRYTPASAAARQQTATVPARQIGVNLRQQGSDPIVPGSVRFSWMGHDYSDANGLLYRDRTATDPGVQCGKVDYVDGAALIDDWASGDDPGTLTIRRLWTRKSRSTTGVIHGRTATAPIRPGGLTLTAVDMAGGTITAQVDDQGKITSDLAWGHMDFATGAFVIMFGQFVADTALTDAERAEWWYKAADVGKVQPGKIWRPRPVDPTTLRYDAVAYTYLPVDSTLMGLTPERLPPDGRMPFIRAGDYAVIGQTVTGAPFVAVAGNTYNTGLTRLSSIDVLGADGSGQLRDGYTVDLDAGTVTFNDVAGWPAQVVVRARIEVYRRVADVRIDGTVRLTTPLGHDFPAGSVLSTALRFGNKGAHVIRLFDQRAWSGKWLDTREGDDATGNYDDTGYPVAVNNRGAITERWALRLRADGQTFDLIGEHLGQIASGTINADFAPTNPNAGTPYFVLKAAGWGSGWTAGNVLFIHTVGAEMPFAFIRSTSPGTPTAADYHALLAVRGSADRPPSTPYP